MTTTFQSRKFIAVALLTLTLIIASATALQLPSDAASQRSLVPVPTPTSEMMSSSEELIAQPNAARPKPVAVATPDVIATQVTASNATPVPAQSAEVGWMVLSGLLIACLLIGTMVFRLAQRRSQLTAHSFAR
jgi:hypothetical protein